MKVSEQRILVVPPNSGLSSGDKRKLRNAGIVVVCVDDPNSVRYLSGEPLPMDANDMLLAALAGLSSNTLTSGTNSKAEAWNTLAKLVAAKGRTP